MSLVQVSFLFWVPVPSGFVLYCARCGGDVQMDIFCKSYSPLPAAPTIPLQQPPRRRRRRNRQQQLLPQRYVLVMVDAVLLFTVNTNIRNRSVARLLLGCCCHAVDLAFADAPAGSKLLMTFLLSVAVPDLCC